ncbi:hypothetical protein R3P38DRAFT_2854128 [Favolaschia claudopus]|uniref:Uncharacterized protein n=1 Tax=Favolaschia claudopus TaxID=2862362 RepID=A0AAW0DQU1_9AGAR
MLNLQTHSLEALRNPGPSWPPQISRIYNLLQLPLPQWCPSESSSPDRMSISPRLDAAAVDSSGDSAETARQNSCLRDFYPFVVHTVDAVNSAMRRDGPQTAWPFVRGFTKVLIATCSENTALLSHASFVLPRLAAPIEGIFDGVAEMLACHIVEGFDKDSSAMDDEKPSSSGVAEVDPHATSAPRLSQDDSDERMGSYSAEISSEASVSDHSPTERSGSFFSASGSALSSTSDQSIDVSLNGHIFQGRGKHSFALLPLLCFADGENIIGIMSSVACQRFVWGISEPTIGFVLSPSGSEMELVLSWVDQSTQVLHVAHDFGQGSKTGCFDFSRVTSILRFSQFLFRLSPCFRLVASIASRLCENNNFDWRSDYPQSKNSETGMDRVALWVQDTQFWRDSQSSSSVPRTLPSADSVQQSQMARQPQASLPSARSQLAAPNEQGLQPPERNTGSKSGKPLSKRVEELSQASSGKSENNSTSSVRDSSSDFAKHPITEYSWDLHLLTYAADRFVRFIGRLQYKEEAFGEEGAKINGMIDLYDQLTSFQWFPSKDANPFPNVVGALSPCKDALVKMAKLIESEQKPISSLDSSMKSKHKLTPDHQAIIKQQIFILLYSSIGARILHGRTGITSFEAESRHDWDALFLSFYVASTKDLLSRNVLFERTFHFAKNKLVETDADKLTETVTAEGNASDAFHGNVHTQAGQIYGRRTKIHIQASLANQQAIALWESYSDAALNKVDGDIPLKRLLHQRSRREPKTGRCDALCFIAVPPGSLNASQIDALNFITRSKDDMKEATRSSKKSDKKAAKKSATTGRRQASSVPKVDAPKSQASSEDIKLTDQTRRDYLQNPHTVSRDLNLMFADAASMPELDFANIALSDFEEMILFPYFIVEYKKKHDTEAKALNQGRLYLIALISYYAALDILDRPFYVLVTNGPKGALLMGWKSMGSERIYVVERNVVQFDISTPLGAYHFATFLLRLREEQKEFEKILQAKVTELQKGFDFTKFGEWHKTWQAVHVDTKWEEAEAIRVAALKAAKAKEEKAAKAKEEAAEETTGS